jgi:serine/threonine-protein kinase RsbW
VSVRPSASRTMHQEIRLKLQNDLRELARVNQLASDFLARESLPEETVYATHLALEEILSNVIRHGYTEAGRHEISVRLRLEAGEVDLVVEDDGREFDPLSAPGVDLDVPLEQRRVGGLGIHLLRKMASEIRYRRVDGRNHLRVRIRPAE